MAASALNGVLSGPGVYEVPETYTGVEYGYGTGKPATIENELGNALETQPERLGEDLIEGVAQY